MVQYIGFSTKEACKTRSTNQQLNNSMNPNQNGIPTGYGAMGQPIIWGKKFTLVDAQLVIQDFINALNIPIGSKVGQPGYGTTLWNFIFEPNTPELQAQLENELRRVASTDPRIDLNTVKSYSQEHGILVEIEMSILPFNDPLTTSLYFDQQATRASLSSII